MINEDFVIFPTVFVTRVSLLSREASVWCCGLTPAATL